MAEDTSRLRIVIDPSGAQDGAKKASAALGEVRTAARQAAQGVEGDFGRIKQAGERSMGGLGQAVRTAKPRIVMDARQAAMAAADGMLRQFKMDEARIRDGLARGLLTPKQAAQAGREAAIAYNAGMVSIIDKASGAGALTGRGGQDTFALLAGRLKDVGGEARRAQAGFGELRESAASLAARMAGVHPIFGRVSNVMGGFALGSTMMVGVMGGMAALGFAWQKLTEKARENRQATEEARDEIRRLVRDRDYSGEYDDIMRNMTAWRQYDSLRAKLDGVRGVAGGPAVGLGVANVAASREALRLEAEVAAALKDAQDGDALLAARREERRKREAKQAADDARGIAKGIEDEAKALARLEAQRAEFAAKQRDREDQAVARQRQNVVDLRQQVALQRAQLAALGNAATDMAGFNRELEITGRLSKLLTPDLIQRAMALDPTAVVLMQKYRDLVAEIVDNEATLSGRAPAATKAEGDPLKATWDEAARGMQRSFTDAFTRIQKDGLAGFEDFGEQLVNIFRRAAAEIAAAMVLDRLGLDDMLAKIQKDGTGSLSAGQQRALKYGGSGIAGFGVGYSSQSAGMGLVGGAGAGFAMGGPVGAAVGALSGLAGGILGAGEAARKAARQFREAMTSVGQSIREMREDAVGIDQWQQARRGVLSEVNSIFDTARGALTGLAGLNDRDIQSRDDIARIIAEARARRDLSITNKAADAQLSAFIDKMKELDSAFGARLEKLEQERLLMIRVGTEDLEVRALVAQGKDKEAEALKRTLAQEREILASRDAGYDDAYRARLRYVHGLEDEAAALDGVSDAMRDVAAVLNGPSGLRVSLHRWRATLPSMDTGVPVTAWANAGAAKPSVVNVGGVTFQPGAIVQQPGEDGAALADRVVAALETKALLGGGNPLSGVVTF